MNRYDIDARLGKDTLRSGLNVFTRRAFNALPALASPRILDIGCGSGVPTLEVAEISGGFVTAIDTDAELLEQCSRRFAAAGLSDRLEIRVMSMASMNFPEGAFDILWAEGSISVIGFERGLREWRRFLRSGGYLTVHDEPGDIEMKKESIGTCGYALIESFIISGKTWWNSYYGPLKKRIEALIDTMREDFDAEEMLVKEMKQVLSFEEEKNSLASVFFVMKRL